MFVTTLRKVRIENAVGLAMRRKKLDLLSMCDWLSFRNFFSGKAKSIVMQISTVMLIFLLFSDK